MERGAPLVSVRSRQPDDAEGAARDARARGIRAGRGLRAEDQRRTCRQDGAADRHRGAQEDPDLDAGAEIGNQEGDMPQHPVIRRSVTAAAFCFGVVVFAALTLQGGQQPSDRQQDLVRGHKPGEWRYWAAGAWRTRSSPLDQTIASNSDSLQMAWQWNAAAFGADEYSRTTPLYANGRLFTVATTRRIAAAIDPESGETLWMWRLNEGIRWQKAPRQFAGRGPAYWSDGNEERVIVVTPGYHMASLDAKTGIPDPKFGKNGVVELMDGLGLTLVPLAVDDAGPLTSSDAAP